MAGIWGKIRIILLILRLDVMHARKNQAQLYRNLLLPQRSIAGLGKQQLSSSVKAHALDLLAGLFFAATLGSSAIRTPLPLNSRKSVRNSANRHLVPARRSTRLHMNSQRITLDSMAESIRLRYCLRFLKSTRDDVLRVWGEIISFTNSSAQECEAGWRPWIQAGSAGLGVAFLFAYIARIAASRAVAAPFAGGFWLTRVLALRWLSGVYFVAFLAAYFQNKELIGDNGILPARYLLRRADDYVMKSSKTSRRGSRSDWVSKLQIACKRIEFIPSLLWLVRDRRHLNRWLDAFAVLGAALSGLAFCQGGASAFHLLVIWVLYHSINSVGQTWYAFGWESQLLETGLLAVLAAPAGFFGSALPVGAAPPLIAVLAFRWLAFRIMLGSGLIKLRGDSCWRDLTAMCHHLETQPVPNQLSRMFHNLPRNVQLFSTASNHIFELFLPWLLLLPLRGAQTAFGVEYIFFQLTLIATGNLSFLNWLTIVPALWCFDDAFLLGILPEAVAQRLGKAVALARATPEKVSLLFSVSWLAGHVRSLLALIAILWLSVPVYTNLLGPSAGVTQQMNAAFTRELTCPGWVLNLIKRAESSWMTSKRVSEKPQFDQQQSEKLSLDLRSLQLLNTYGAFGTVSKERIEIVFEGTIDGVSWHPYTFKVAVDDPRKRPSWISPYHLRLDWCRWISACSGQYVKNMPLNRHSLSQLVAVGLIEPWVISFVGKLLEGDDGTRSLLAKSGDPFVGTVPKKIRAQLYEYKFAPVPIARSEPYWRFTYFGSYLPALGLEDVNPMLARLGLAD